MRDSDLAEYLAHDPVPEEAPKPERSYPPEAGRAPPGHQPGVRSATCERDQFVSDVVRMVMEIFPGARWTTRDEYRRAAANRDRKGRRRRG
jgi:hypothetical protein